MDQILSSQQQFFRKGNTYNLDFRIEALQKLGNEIEEKEVAILDALKSDLEKPRIEAYLSEVYFTKQELRLYAKKLRKWARPKKAGSPFYHFPERTEIRREPFGNSLLISPWNYPFQISLAPLISSIAAGNTVILKPSEFAPATSAILKSLVESVFSPEHAIVIEGGPEVSQSLLNHKFDLMFFTGSERVGKIVAQAAAQNLIPTILELGGKCPVIVDPSADLDLAAERIVRTKYFNAGQTCLAPDYLCVHESRKTDLVGKIEKRTQELYGNQESLLGDLSRIINQNHWNRLQGLLQNETVIQVGSDQENTLLLAPRILPDSSWDSLAMSEEIFGPILPIVTYQTEEDLISNINRNPNPLALYLFSKDTNWTTQTSRRIPSGNLGINDIIKAGINLDLPLGGVGNSGMGRYRGKYGFDAFTYPRATSRRWFTKDIFTIEPPYDGKFEKNRKILK